jgi:hypothetical protein
MNPRPILRAEGVAVFAAASAAYFLLDGPLWLYAVLFFAPDLGMVGYAVNPRVGSHTYNLVHTYVLPIALLGLGVWQAVPLAVLVAAIWAAHIGFDRVFGFGLKFRSEFGATHLGPERFTDEGSLADHGSVRRTTDSNLPK